MGLEDIAARNLGRFRIEGGKMVPSDTEDDLERLMEPKGPRDLGRVWCKAVGKATGQMCRPLTVAHEGILKNLATATGQGTPDYSATAAIVVQVVLDWDGFVARCQREAGARRCPTRPILPFLSTFWQQAMNHVTQPAEPRPHETPQEERGGTSWKPGQLSKEEREKLLQEALEDE